MADGKHDKRVSNLAFLLDESKMLESRTPVYDVRAVVKARLPESAHAGGKGMKDKQSGKTHES